MRATCRRPCDPSCAWAVCALTMELTNVAMVASASRMASDQVSLVFALVLMFTLFSNPSRTLLANLPQRSRRDVELDQGGARDALTDIFGQDAAIAAKRDEQ